MFFPLLKRWRIFLLTLLVVGALLAGQAFYVEPSRLIVKSYQLPIAGMPPLRIAALSDLHVGAPHITRTKLQQVVQMTNAQQPDLIVLLGDYVIQGVVGGSFVEPREIAEDLRALQAPLGVYGVLGNHDHRYNGKKISQEFSRVGIHMLDHHTQRLEWRGVSFWLMGLGDFFKDPSNWRAVIAQVNDAAPIIAITHNPDVFAELPPRVNLMLAGHTHGGQCNFPWFGRPIVPSMYDDRYAIGLVYENGHHIFITPGIGTSILPVRFRVTPEISLIQFKPEEDRKD
ncbi:MAG: metallophosphoesterase [Acidobacteria bacterium]|nr:metallophosphoesterase [Acidobacteriota bacterium]